MSKPLPAAGRQSSNETQSPNVQMKEIIGSLINKDEMF